MATIKDQQQSSIEDTEKVSLAIPKRFNGFRLIPLRPYSKIPMVTWKNDTTYDLNDYPNITGYSVDCGKSGLVVIDCDVKNEVNGHLAFIELLAKNDETTPTLIVETPSGGVHYYYLSNGISIGSSAGTALGPGIDIRASGGLIVGPGSAIKTSVTEEVINAVGEIEAHEVEKKGSYTFYSDEDVEIAPLPKWLEKILTSDSQNESQSEGKRRTKKKSPILASAPTLSHMSALEDDKRRILSWGLDEMRLAVKGNRNETLNRMSWLMGCGRVKKEEAARLIDVALELDLPELEARKTFYQAHAKGLEEEEQDFSALRRIQALAVGKSVLEDPLDSAYYTHLALSYNFYKYRKNDFIYWGPGQCWYEYIPDEGRWVQIPETYLISAVDKFVENLVPELRKQNPKIPPNIFKLQERLWSKATVDSIAAFAKRRFLVKDPNLFDADPYLANAKNGVIDLRTGELLEKDRELFITKYIPVDYDPDCDDFYFQKVISSIHPDEVEFLQMFLGQALTGHQPRSQVALFLHGRGSNGKSTLIDLALKTSGDYGSLLPPAILADDKQGGDSYATSGVESIRCAVVEELPDSRTLSSGALKRIVGTQKINSRKLYKDYKEFTNVSTIFVSCNKLPMVTEMDDGTWRRILVIHFPYSYKKTQSQVKGPYDRLGDPRVLHAAQNRAATSKTFLAWRVAGAVRWFSQQNIESVVPKTIEENVDKWRDNNDLMRSWLRTEMVYDPFTVCVLEDLRASFNAFLVSRGHAVLTQRHFIEMLTNHSEYHDNGLDYKRNSRITKDYNRSIPKISDYSPKVVSGNVNMIVGVGFRVSA